VPIFAKTPVANGGLGLGPDAYLNAHWGLQLMIAGIVGPMAGGWARDKVFQSRCGPPAALFYGILITATIAMCFLLRMPIVLAVICFCMSLSYIGSQGLLTSTAAMDFGGKAKATATGVIDGFVYIGSTVESLCLGWLTTSGSTTVPPTSTAQGWSYYPIFLVPFAVIGFVLALKIWSATADRQPVKGASAH